MNSGSLSLRRLFAFVVLSLCLVGALAPSLRADLVSSPNGSLVANVTTSGGNLVYSVTFNGATVIESSRLGVTVNGADLGSGTSITGGTNGSSTFNFPSRHGVHASVNGQAKSRLVNLIHSASGRSYAVNVAVWDNGLAIRYELGGTDAKNVTAEASTFALPSGSLVYYQGDSSVYEDSFGSGDIGAIAANTSMGSPVTVKLPGSTGYLAITQTALTNVGLLPNPYLVKASGGTGRQLQVAYPVNANGTRGYSTSADIRTPWNVIMVGAGLNALVNNDIVESLVPAPSGSLFPQGAATSWCKPGRSVWDYLNKHPGGITPDNAKLNNSWAAKMGFEYNTIDEGWAGWNGGNPWPQVQDVCTHAATLNVRVLLWKHSSELATPSQRAAFFQQLQSAGVAGFKADFFDYNGVSAAARERVQLMRDILQEAAGYQLVANFHGASKPVGLFRTYPNLLQVEAVYGRESFAGTFNMTLQPFTRFLAGPADFTPLSLQGEFKGSRTAAFEIALVATMPGPVVTFAERSDNIGNSPFAYLINKVPSMWDETIVLNQSQLGQTCAMARRKGDDWFLAITNGGASRSWTIPLTFLASGVTYHLDLVRDSSTGIESSTQNSTGALAVSVANGGGLLARFYRAPSSGTYAIANRKSTLVLAPNAGGTANDTYLVQTYYNGGSSMRWNVTDLGGGQVRLAGVASGRTVSVDGAQTGNNAAVELFDYSNASHQKVTLTANGSGFFTPIFVHSGRAMTVLGASTSPGARIIQYAYNAGTNAQWEFRRQ